MVFARFFSTNSVNWKMDGRLGGLARYRSVFIGNARRLSGIGGSEAQRLLSSSGIQFLKDISRSEIVITTRWWDPSIALLRLFKPEIISVFIADGHFSLLNLNKTSNKRRGKNILESGYCDVYLLPDHISLDAVAKHPGLKFSYRPHYWDDPGICLSGEEDKRYDIVFVYGNDPFFEVDGHDRLLAFVNRHLEYFGKQYSIAHVLPEGNNGEFIAENLCCRDNIFVGLSGANMALCKGSVYLCTPSTMVWQLLSASGKVALIDAYDADPCFHPSIPRVREPGDLPDIIDKDEEYWIQLREKVEDVLGKESIVEVLSGILGGESSAVNSRAGAWRILKSHSLRDYFSSAWSMAFKQ